MSLGRLLKELSKEVIGAGSICVGSDDLEKWDANGQNFRQISLITLVAFDLERPNSAE